MLIDTHAHLYLEGFDSDRDKVLQNAVSAGVSHIVLPNIDQDSVLPMMKMVIEYPTICFPLIGIHPCSVKDDFENDLKFINDLLVKNRFWGIGEIGLDYYWDKALIKEQIHAFEIQLDLAIEHQLPAIIHIRESFEDTWSILSKRDNTGILHCYPGSLEQAKKVIDKGFLLGIGGVLTFKNAHLVDVIKGIDLKYIVLETDSPFLTPAPFRGKRNEPSYLVPIAQKIAEIKGVDFETVARITTENAKRIFKFEGE